MNDKTLRLLEFDIIRQRVADYCVGEEAAAALLETVPLTDSAAVASLKTLTMAFSSLLESGVPEPRLSFPAIGALLPLLGKEGAALEGEGAYALGVYAEAAGRLRAWLLSGENDAAAPYMDSGARVSDALRKAAAEVPDCAPVASAVFQVFDRDGSLRDLPAFRAIKKRLGQLRHDLETLTNSYLVDEDKRRMLQSDVATQRDGRLVLAVKANFRGRIKGIVHEVSGTGQTLFVEPEEVVEKNNEILIEERHLAAEIARVLRELTSRLGQYKEALSLLREKIIWLDGIRARARYGLVTSGIAAPADESAPQAAHNGRLVLRQARHPLLGAAAVPIDIAMAETLRVVIVTGPNTGGKTVALKTVGLFALMNQFGLAIPAADGSVLPVFDAVYADIGDEQSISQSLSTFSAHMTNIASIVNAATERSLVLLDELGSGTDPEEGSAIAMALLDYFIDLRARVLATSHHGILKNYGYTKMGVINASVDFDLKTLSPTFRLLMGIPGESRALDIALRNGLNQGIVKQARSYVDEERADISALISGLKAKHGELEAADATRREQESALREDRRRVDLKELRLRQREAELRNLGLGELRRLLDESRKTLENLVRELREGELDRSKTLKVKKFLADLDKRVQAVELQTEQQNLALSVEEEKYRNALEENAVPKHARSSGKVIGARGKKAVPPIVIGPGTDVLIGTAARRGRVVRAGKKGAWVVEVGAVKMTLMERELRPVPGATDKPKVEIKTADLSPSAPAALELNLLGFRMSEALEALRRQLDSAALSGLYQFSVIHGKGDGVLQRAVHEYLKTQPVVADYYFARADDGGFGKTMVVLKN